MKFIVEKENRINKAMQEAGICSRREADKKIEIGKVFINGRLAKLGMIAEVGDTVTIKDKARINRYALYYKPRGEITGVSQREKLEGLHPVGRLDKDSEGLLIYTNDHRLVEAVLNPKNKIEKEYKVKIREKATPRVERILMSGITTQEGKYNPVKAVRIGEDAKTVFITLTEGKKHEIRRMFNALLLTIDSLTRIKIMNFRIMNMKPGQIRELEEKDFAKILPKEDHIKKI